MSPTLQHLDATQPQTVPSDTTPMSTVQAKHTSTSTSCTILTSHATSPQPCPSKPLYAFRDRLRTTPPSIRRTSSHKPSSLPHLHQPLPHSPGGQATPLHLVHSLWLARPPQALHHYTRLYPSCQTAHPPNTLDFGPPETKTLHITMRDFTHPASVFHKWLSHGTKHTGFTMSDTDTAALSTHLRCS